MTDQNDARQRRQPTPRSDSRRARRTSAHAPSSASALRAPSGARPVKSSHDGLSEEAAQRAAERAQRRQERQTQASGATPRERSVSRESAAGLPPLETARNGAAAALSRVKPIYLLAILGAVLALFLITRIASCVRQAQGGSTSPGTTATANEPQRVNVMMVGDILVHQGVWESGEQSDGTYDYSHLFAHIADDLEQADIAMLDQETVLGGRELGLSGYPTFNGPQEIADAEVKAGFDVILHASNHAMDYGDAGLSSELTYWHDTYPGMLVAGAVIPGTTTAAQRGATYWRQGDFVIAILNYTYDLNGYEDPSDAVFEIDEEQMRADIEAAEAKADLTIVCPHWGDEGTFVPTSEQRELAQRMCEWGVDLVFGNHPHVPQPVEVITSEDGSHQMPVFWSVGNFVSTMLDKENLVAGIGKAVLVKDGDDAYVESVSFEPIVTHRGYGDEMTTYHLADYTEELAATNYWRSDDVPVYPDEAEDIFADIVGSNYDRENDVLSISLVDQPSEADEAAGTADEPADKAA